MAELFLAKDTRKDRMVVLKRILPYLAEEAEFVRMFLDEARIAASLHHPSIVELFELGHLEGSTFISMEWVDGIDLRRVLQKEQERKGVVPAGVAAWLMARLCEGLHHAHFAKDAAGMPLGIIHRDVSPQNVMVSFNADVKLVDFGIAKATAWMGRSKPGVIKGKFLFLAPEQLTTEPLDHRTDLFALGTMLYELTTGQSPFYRTSTEAVIYAIRMEEPDHPTKVKKDFPPGLAKIILKCLVKDRDQRFQTADEIRQALEDFTRVELPTTFEDVQSYVSRLFGDDSERTSIFIPPNAQSPSTHQPSTHQPSTHQPSAGQRLESRTDTSTQRDKALSGGRVPTSPPVPEGRRETGDLQLSENTSPTKSDRPRVKTSPRAPAGGNPWEPEVTAPMPREAVARRDFQATAELDHERALGVGVPPTAVSVFGARDVEVGQVIAPLIPTLANLDAVPALRSTRVPALEAPRPRAQVKPTAPPVASYDSLPELSAVSAGDATLGALMEASPSEVSQLSEPTAPSPPPPSTRAPPRKGPPMGIRRPAPREPDDEIATVDQANEFSVTRRSSSHKALIGIFGVAVLVVVILVGVLFWPSGEAAKAEKPTPTPVTAPSVTPKTAPPRNDGLVQVLIRAEKGTVMTVDGKPVAPEATLERPVGELVLKFTCAAKKKVKMNPGTLRAQIPASDSVVAVVVPCK